MDVYYVSAGETKWDKVSLCLWSCFLGNLNLDRHQDGRGSAGGGAVGISGSFSGILYVLRWFVLLHRVLFIPSFQVGVFIGCSRKAGRMFSHKLHHLTAEKWNRPLGWHRVGMCKTRTRCPPPLHLPFSVTCKQALHYTYCAHSTTHTHQWRSCCQENFFMRMNLGVLLIYFKG